MIKHNFKTFQPNKTYLLDGVKGTFIEFDNMEECYVFKIEGNKLNIPCDQIENHLYNAIQLNN